MELLFALFLSLVGNFDRIGRGHVVPPYHAVVRMQRPSRQSPVANVASTIPVRPARPTRP